MAILPTTDIVARPQSHGYDGHIDNVLIRLAVSEDTPMEDITAEAAPKKIDTSESAEDVRDETGERYSRSNLSGGAGLDFLHSPARPEDAALRFWDSKGVDVFATDRGDIYDARLMRRMDGPVSSVSADGIAQVDGAVYYLSGTLVKKADGTTFATLSAAGLSLIAMGNSLYTLDSSSGVQRFDLPSATPVSVTTTTTYTRIWGVKQRILGVVDNILYELGGTDTARLTLSPNDTITDVIDAGESVLVFSTSGYIHALGDDDTYVLVEKGKTPFVEEIPVMAAQTQGTIGLVTADLNDEGGRVARFYTATLNGAVIGNMQLIFQVGDRDTTLDLTPQAICSTRDSIYVAVPEENDDEITIWRYYLPTAGYARAYTLPRSAVIASSPLNGIVGVDDRMWAAYEYGGATYYGGLWKETDEYVVSGYVIGPLADFYTADEKQWVSAELSGTELHTGTTLDLYDTLDPALINNPDSAEWALATRLLTGQSISEIDSLTDRNGRFHAAKVVLASDASRLFSPGLRSYSFRALPNPNRDILIRIPINVSDQIEAPKKRALSISGRGNLIESALRAYEGRRVPVEIYRPALRVQGLVEKFESTVESISYRGAVRRVMYARIRGTRFREPAGYAGTTSGMALGLTTLGTTVLGTGEIR